VEETPPEAILTPERLDPDTRLMADAAADFLRGEVLPVADRLQEQEPGLMPSLLRRAAALGLLGLDIPEEYGGLGLPKSASARLAEALAAEPSFAVSHNVHTSVASLPLVFFGTPEQKAKYLPRLASGEWIGAYALSEAHAGSDALAARTRAVPSADGKTFTLTGEKMWITNAAFADLFTVFAKVDGEKFTAFLVERDSPGISIGREERKLGLKGSSTCRLILDNVPVPAENALGEIGEGAKVALYTLNLGRFKIAANAVGQSKNLLGLATRYAKQRRAFGKPIAEHGLIQEKLATMAARLFAAESMLYRVAGYLDAASSGRRRESGSNTRHPVPDTLVRDAAEEYAIECALIKVACTETLDYIADECLQIHGGYGYSEEFPAARAWRDARVNRIYEGTNEINRLNMVELLLKRMEQGRIRTTLAPQSVRFRTLSSGTRVPGLKDQRLCLLRVLSAAYGSVPDLSQQQEMCRALANLLIFSFAWESACHRVVEIDARASGENRIPIAGNAARLIFGEANACFRECIASILGRCGKQGWQTWAKVAGRLCHYPDDAIEARGNIAAAVIEADGYPW